MESRDGGLQNALGAFLRNRTVFFVVDPHHLRRMTILRAAQEPFFDRGQSVLNREPALAIDMNCIQQLVNGRAGRVVPDDGRHDNWYVESREHGCHASCASQAIFLLYHPDQWDGGFGTDPFDIARQVTIEHHVANDQNPWTNRPAQ